MKKMFFYIFFLIPLFAISNPMNYKILTLNPSSEKALEAAIRHRDATFPKKDYSATIEESETEIRIIFSIPQNNTAPRLGGGDKLIIYSISKNDFAIKNVEEKLSR